MQESVLLYSCSGCVFGSAAVKELVHKKDPAGPVSWFELSHSESSTARAETWEGIGPCKLLLLRCSSDSLFNFDI